MRYGLCVNKIEDVGINYFSYRLIICIHDLIKNFCFLLNDLASMLTNEGTNDF